MALTLWRSGNGADDPCRGLGIVHRRISHTCDFLSHTAGSSLWLLYFYFKNQISDIPGNKRRAGDDSSFPRIITGFLFKKKKKKL